MATKLVYLAGPITGLNYEGATDWRDYARGKLATHGIIGVSPMRAKEFLRKLKEMPSDGRAKDEHGLGVPKGFVTRDRLDVSRCDAVLMNLKGAKDRSIGTMVEIGWADTYRKPIVLVMEPEGNVHEHGFVRELTQYQVTELDRGIETLAAILQD